MVVGEERNLIFSPLFLLAYYSKELENTFGRVAQNWALESAFSAKMHTYDVIIDLLICKILFNHTLN